MGRRTVLLAAMVALLSSCRGKGDGSQVWEFTLTTASGAPTASAVSCASDGTCSGGAWTLSSSAEGCLLQVTFDTRFAGRAVELSNFQRAGASTCGGPSLPRGDSAGHGTADAAWPEARRAAGEATVGFVGVLYVPGAPFPQPWVARRVEP